VENEDGKLSVVTDANIEKAVGWKEGLFVFDKTSIQEIMRELARWYDVEVEYAQPLEKSYHFMIGRDQSLSKILNIMETTGDVKFIIEGKKITVFN
jgi:Fe2+-dicitrate sensor, membrane component